MLDNQGSLEARTQQSIGDDTEVTALSSRQVWVCGGREGEERPTRPDGRQLEEDQISRVLDTKASSSAEPDLKRDQVIGL